MAPTPQTGIEIRAAAPADRDAILDVMYRQPGPEMLGSCGTVEASRRFGAALLDLGGFPSSSKPVVVATMEDRVVGMLQYVSGGSGALGVLDTVRVALRGFGVRGSVARIPAAIARARVELPVIQDELYLSEVHVDPELRGHGIGGALLDWVDEAAAEAGASTIWLITGSANPARRLYQRHGYTVTAERSSAGYQSRTGSPGRVRMQKPAREAATASGW